MNGLWSIEMMLIRYVDFEKAFYRVNCVKMIEAL